MTIPNMEHTGERLVPESSDPTIFWEHIYRYRFAMQFVPGKNVLDIASGEGYGTAALKQGGALSVIGVDISEEACAYARQKYGVDVRQGSAESIPLTDNSIDVIVSFETIEHVTSPSKFLDECARVLRPGGTLIISTPNKDVYATEAQHENPFHCSELTESEFISLLKARFSRFTLFTQRPKTAAPWSIRNLATQEAGLLTLKRAIRFITCSHIRPKYHANYKQNPIKAITMPGGFAASVGNPYFVRKQHQLHQEKPTYFLAVATSSDK